MPGPAGLPPAALPGVLSRRTVVGVEVLVWNTGSAAFVGVGVWMPKPAKALNTSLRLAASVTAAAAAAARLDMWRSL